MKQPRGCHLALILVLASTAPVQFASAQAPVTPVRVTEARSYDVRRTVELSGTVEPTTSSLVAAEVSGVVAQVHAREGDYVVAGAPIAVLQTRDLQLRRQAQAGELQEAQARLEFAVRALERARGLVQEDLISEDEFDSRSADFAAWTGRVAQLEAQIALTEYDLERCTVRAPFAGAVVSEQTEVGQWIGEGDPVCELISVDEIDVRVEVPERYFPQLSVGASARVHLESASGLDLEGTVVARIPRADSRARTFPIKVRIPNPDRAIGAGMLTRVALPLGESHEAVIVPKDAIASQGDSRFVYVVEDGSVVQLAVTIGEGVGDWVVVEGGLAAGASVVTRGNERLRPGQAVSGEPIDYPLP